MVKAVFDGGTAHWPARTEHEKENYRNSINPQFEAQVFVLPTPIATAADLKDIVSVTVAGKTLRHYPPFPLNEKGEASGPLTDAAIPEGASAVTDTSPLPNEAVTGVRAEHGLPNGRWCRGLRIDVEHGADAYRVIRSLLDHVCQYTQQWWVRGTHDPFLGMLRSGVAVDRNFHTVKLFGYKGAERIESPWYGGIVFQPVLGRAALLSTVVWIKIAQHISRGESADTGVLGIHASYADYMAGRDKQCILNLCIGIEILLNKHRQAVLKKPTNESLDKVIRNTPLLDERTRETLEKLMIDRGHVAHGREPYIIATNTKYTLEKYLVAGRTVLEKYLQSIPAGERPQFMTMTLRRGTKNTM
jgi:hypothetical protein